MYPERVVINATIIAMEFELSSEFLDWNGKLKIEKPASYEDSNFQEKIKES